MLNCNHQLAAELKGKGVTVSDIKRSLKGFSATLTAEQATSVSEDPRVDFVEQDSGMTNQ